MMDTETGEDSHQRKKKKGENLKYSFSTIESYPATKHCHYSGLPSPSAYEKESEKDNK